MYSFLSPGPSDYFLAPTVVRFPAGSIEGDRQCVTISITDDEIAENTEAFHVVLSTNDSEVDIHSVCPRASVSISDSDGMYY